MALDHKKGDGFVMLVNSDGVDDFFREVLYAIADVYGFNIWDPKEITRISIDLNDYQNYIGRYREDDEEEDYFIDVIIKDDQLYYQEIDGEDIYEFPLIPISKHVFIDGIDGNKIEFKTDGDKVLGAMYDNEYSYTKI